jgi:hypothetical protein
MVRIYVRQLKRLFLRLKYYTLVFRIDDPYLLRKRPLALAPSIRDEERMMLRRKFHRIYRLEDPDEHELPVIFPANIITNHRKLQIRPDIHAL